MIDFVGSKLSNQAADWRKGCRLRAWEPKQEGWKQCDHVKSLGVIAGAVSQWMKRAEYGGIEALGHRKAPGGPSRLTAGQRARISELLR